MIIICCLTDCLAAITLAYEKAESDVLLRPPRNIKVDRLANWRLLCHAYFFVGSQQCVASFAMAYWYAARHGVGFKVLWAGFGRWEGDERVQTVLNEASSIYFVNLVVMWVFFFNL
jgi:sodium/potassium-transporting ATPase subunit alpha